MIAPAKKFEVLLTAGAEQDIEAIYGFITEHDCVERAHYVLAQIEAVIENLANFPERGSYPKELLEIGIKEYKQVAFKPYRVIYPGWPLETAPPMAGQTAPGRTHELCLNLGLRESGSGFF